MSGSVSFVQDPIQVLCHFDCRNGLAALGRPAVFVQQRPPPARWSDTDDRLLCGPTLRTLHPLLSTAIAAL